MSKVVVELLIEGTKPSGCIIDGKIFAPKAGESETVFSFTLAKAIEGETIVVSEEEADDCKKFFAKRRLFPVLVVEEGKALHAKEEDSVTLITGAGSNNVDLAIVNGVRIDKFKHWTKYGLNYIYFDCTNIETGEQFSYRYNIATGKRSYHQGQEPSSFYNLAEIAKLELPKMGLNSYEEVAEKYVA